MKHQTIKSIFLFCMIFFITIELEPISAEQKRPAAIDYETVKKQVEFDF